MKPRAKEINIREADGGFIINDFHADKPRVAKTLAAVIKALKETFSSSEADETSEDE